MMAAPINAPAAELRLALALRRYERIKLTLLVIAVVLATLSDIYVVGLVHSGRKLSKDNHASLVILRCVVDPTVQTDAHGHRRTNEDTRRAFNACVARSAP